MTVWTSVLWEIDIQLAKKWPEMVVKLAIVIVIRFYSDYSDTQRSPIKDNQVKKSWTKSVLFSKNHMINHIGPKSFEPIHTTSLWNIIFQWNFHDDLTEKSAEIFFCISKNGIISEGQWQILKIIFVLALDKLLRTLAGGIIICPWFCYCFC